MQLTRLDDLVLFVALVEAGSFTGAAKKLNMPKSTISRRLVGLEKKLNSQLLIRSTRSQQLTESGRLLYFSCNEHIQALTKVEEEISSLIHLPKGRLNILLPLEFFNRIISILIADFVKLYPEIELNCQHYSGALPEYDHHYDLSFVLHEQSLPASNWIARELLSFPQSIYAAQGFDSSLLKAPEDLAHYCCVLAEDNQPWLFRDNNKVQAVYVKGRVILASPEMRHQATLQQLGLSKLPDYVLASDGQKSLLRRIPLTKEPLAQQLSVLYQSRNIAIKTRTFLDYFQSNIGKLLL